MASHWEILLKYQADLESSLQDIDLLKFSRDLYRNTVICKDASDKFVSLDPDLDHLESEVKVRYLLKLVYERVREDGRVYERFVRVLSKLRGEVKLVCEAMKKENAAHEAVDCTSDESQHDGNVFLTVKDVSLLVELIVAGSHKWEEIGVALGVPEYVREECRSAGSNPLKLSKLLSVWISGQYKDAKTTSLNSLKTVLNGGLVKLPDVAENLDKFCSASEYSSFPQISSKDLCLIEYQSGDTEVAEDKSTLLEVQGNYNLHESYQWSKDGEPLLDGADFSGVCSNILYINRASQCTEGKYSCCVSRGSETVCSDEMSLSVIYPPEKKQLLEFYSLTEREVPQDSWPPVGNSTFINLVLIRQKPMSTCDYYTIRGDMDDILESKEKADYKEVFRDYREGALVLVEGRPGSGKTTLVHKLTRDWASGKKVLQGAKVVFLLTLRLLTVFKKDKRLLDLLQVYFYDEEFSKQIEHTLIRCGGKGACFILDGLDEYPIEAKKNLVIDQLLFTKTFLPFSMVIVASRPVATKELKTLCKLRIEVVGFFEDQIYSYVRSYPFSDCSPTMASKMIDYLDQHPNVLHMCYLPIHAAMICFLFSQLEGNIPHRETQIYEQFTIATLLKHKARKGGEVQLKSLQDLNSEEKELFKSVCKLAFDMIVNSQQVVSKSDAQVYLFLDSALELLTVERTSKYYGSEDFYTFSHLTLQEFLAAVHIHEAEIEDEKLIRHNGFKNVLKFYSGLSKSVRSIKFVQKIIEIFYLDLSYQVQCAYESQQVELCDRVLNCGEEKVSGRTTSTDFIALGYVISKTTKLLNKIVWDSLNYGLDGIKLFVSMATDRKLQSIKCLELTYGNEENFKALNYLLLHLPFLEQLDMSGHFLTLNKCRIEYLTSEVTLPHLKVLQLSIPLVPPCSHPERILKQLTFNSKRLSQVFYSVHYDLEENLVVWSKIFRYVFGCQTSSMSWLHLYNMDNYPSLPHERLSHCTEVVLVNCCIGDEGAEILANTLSTSVLENLVLDFNRITDTGAVALAGCLARCSVVQEVSIECNCIGDSGATALADALVHCSSLRRLDLQGNSLGDKGAVAIAKATESLPRLDLYLHNVNISEEGVERVLECRARTRIRSMEFTSSWDSVSEGSIDTLKRALYCGYLPALKLSSSNISVVKELVTEQECVMNVSGIECEDDVISEDTVPTLCCIINNLQSLYFITIKLYHNIRSTCVQNLSDSLKDCKSLRSLKLHSEFDNKLPNSLLDVVRCYSQLKSLSLSNGDISSYGVDLLFGNHESWINLNTLKLLNCSLGSDGTQVLSRILIHCKKLCCLDLSYNDIGDRGVLALAEGLKDHTSLLELNMSNNDITSVGMIALSQVIECDHLHNLNLNNNSIAECVPILVDVICHDNLQTLQLRSIGLGVDGIPFLREGLKKCTQLVKLDISENSIGSDGVVSLAEGLQYCTNLRELNLSDNDIKSDNIDYVGAFGDSDYDIQYDNGDNIGAFDDSDYDIQYDNGDNIGAFDDSDYDIQYDNGDNIGAFDDSDYDIQYDNSDITSDNSDNIISDGVTALYGILTRCKYLRRLDLGNNSIGVEDVVTLVDGLQHKSVLTLDTCFDDPHMSALKKGEKCCSSCDRLLELYYNNDYVYIPGIPKLVSPKF